MHDVHTSTRRARARAEYVRVASQQLAMLQQHIIKHLGCDDCGAEAGEYCKPDYGCAITNRTVR